MSITILGIESSCDDTAATIIRDGYLLSSKIANQDIHKEYGGVVPELASRAHMQNIIPVVESVLRSSEIKPSGIDAVAFTRGPGLLGSLLVGTSFAKGFALARKIPLIEVHHLQAHIMIHFIKSHTHPPDGPEFPFLCLLVSGGHTQLVTVKDHLDMEIIGSTIDDAAGEAFDKSAKLMGLPYPGGPQIDKLSSLGDQNRFNFSKPRIAGLDYSFSGLKTSILYFLRDMLKEDPEFINKNINDLCASIQKTIIDALMEKLIKASEQTGIKQIAIAGGVSANSGLRKKLESEAGVRNWKTYIPELRFTTDNAAMIAIAGFYKYQKGIFAPQNISPLARMNF